MGRFTATQIEELKTEIINRISLGEPLRQICRDDHMPNFSLVYVWRDKDMDFDKRFDEARRLGFDAIADDCLNIADDGVNDFVEKQGRNGTYIALDKEHVQRSKLRVWTRLQLLAKWDPKRYGDRSTTDFNFNDASLTPAERVEKLRGILLAAEKRKEAKASEDDELI